ncbi:MAG: hypothetical protein IJY91_02240 [Oscillospiraceae bacterium]|nr:hypothetical protein [Oscillospiraceae bacterium]
MKKFIENLANLVKVKTIVTLVVITVFAVLALKGAIPADNVLMIVSTVIAFYFGTQHEKTTTATVPSSQPPAAVIGTVPENATYGDISPVDPATYNQTHPDTTA